MEHWTNAQRAFAVKAFYENADSVVRTQRAFRREFNLPPRAPVPSRKAILLWVSNFETLLARQRREDVVIKKYGPQRTLIVCVKALGRSPRKSARRHSAQLGLSNRSVRRILKNDLHYHPYKIQVVQVLNPNDFNTRIRFCQAMLTVIDGNGERVQNLWMSDEAPFHLCGYVNKQNFRYWSANDPHELLEKPLHSEKVTVWCAMSSRAIVGPYFFEDDNGRTVRVNSERYADMLATFGLPGIDRYDSDGETLFQQDGATSYTANVSMDFLRLAFPGRLISRNGDIPWPDITYNTDITSRDTDIKYTRLDSSRLLSLGLSEMQSLQIKSAKNKRRSEGARSEGNNKHSVTDASERNGRICSQTPTMCATRRTPPSRHHIQEMIFFKGKT